VTRDSRRDEATHASRWLIAPPLAVILLLTLMPAGGIDEPVARICFACGERAIADALLNVLLFAPLGAALAAGGIGVLATAVAGFALSLSIEIAQIWIPGRITSLSDVVTNGTGALVGWLLVRSGAALWRTPARRRALAFVAVALPVLVIGATAVLLAPAFPRDHPYFAQWTPVLGLSAVYDGRITDSRIAGHFIAPLGATTPATLVRDPLLAGEPLFVEGVTGSWTPRRAPILGIAADSRYVLFIVADRDDAILRVRTRADALRLDQPEFRLPGAFRDPVPGAPLRIDVRRDGRHWCLRVNEASRCGLAHTIADGWMLLMYPSSWPAAAHRTIGWLWLFVAAAPAGLLGAGRARSVLVRGGVIASGIVAVVLVTGSLDARVEHGAALAAGYLSAALLRAALERRKGRTPAIPARQPPAVRDRGIAEQTKRAE
jgi:hypothetical protein